MIEMTCHAMARGMTQLRHIWMFFGLFFMLSNFYQLNLHNKTCFALASL